MRHPRYSWPGSDAARGVLMLAQQIAEMLSPQSFESYRVYTLCTVSRLQEASLVIEDVQRNRINKLALEPVLHELRWSLEKDPVANGLAGSEIVSFHRLVEAGQYSLPGLLAHLILLQKLIGEKYKDALEAALLETFHDPQARNQLRVLAGFYCSYLVNRGYSKNHIAKLVESQFLSGPQRRVGRASLRKFFGSFKQQPSKYKVYAAVSKEFGQFLKSLGFEVASKVGFSADIVQCVDGDDQFSSIVTDAFEAFDSYSAAAKQNLVLTNVRALTFLAHEGLPCTWSQKKFVQKARDTQGAVEEQADIVFERQSSRARSSARQVRDIKKYSLRILQNFDRRSNERLLASINTSAQARTTPSPENKLISLWSAVEVLLSEPEVGVPRIVHYSKLLVPCICLRHIRLQFAAVSDELLVSYKRKFKDIVSRETAINGIDIHSRFASVMLLPPHGELRADLLRMCSDNPLACHRLYRLNSDFQSSAGIYKALNSHERRVEWQIHRIYRARNNLVHAGRVPTYLDSLIMNLFEYYRTSIATIVNRARREERRSDIDQIVAEIGIAYGIFKEVFHKRKSNELSISDLRGLISLDAEDAE
jgi:hypothetical protein